jgi:hypothetical protein
MSTKPANVKKKSANVKKSVLVRKVLRLNSDPTNLIRLVVRPMLHSIRVSKKYAIALACALEVMVGDVILKVIQRVIQTVGARNITFVLTADVFDSRTPLAIQCLSSRNRLLVINTKRPHNPNYDVHGQRVPPSVTDKQIIAYQAKLETELKKLEAMKVKITKENTYVRQAAKIVKRHREREEDDGAPAKKKAKRAKIPKKVSAAKDKSSKKKKKKKKPSEKNNSTLKQLGVGDSENDEDDE